MSKRTLDIVGQPCDKCGKGVAKVVHFVPSGTSHRFFYGCSASTAAVPCKGSRVWQAIQVPEELRQEVDANREAGHRAAGRKPGAKRAMRDFDVDPDNDEIAGQLVFEEVKTETTTSVTKRTIIKKRGVDVHDASYWSKPEDDDYVE